MANKSKNNNNIEYGISNGIIGNGIDIEVPGEEVTGRDMNKDYTEDVGENGEIHKENKAYSGSSSRSYEEELELMKEIPEGRIISGSSNLSQDVEARKDKSDISESAPVKTKSGRISKPPSRYGNE